MGILGIVIGIVRKSRLMRFFTMVKRNWVYIFDFYYTNFCFVGRLNSSFVECSKFLYTIIDNFL